MIRYSQMHKIIQDTTGSFGAKKKVHLKISSDILERDQMLFKYKKYETWPLSDFKLYILWLVFRTSGSKFDIFNILNKHNPEDKKNFINIRDKIILYKNTLKEELEFLTTKIITKENILSMLNRQEITPISAWYFLCDETNLTILQQRKVDQLRIFFEFLPKIDSYIKSAKSKKKLK